MCYIYHYAVQHKHIIYNFVMAWVKVYEMFSIK
jgi:hypothetical protein